MTVAYLPARPTDSARTTLGLDLTGLGADPGSSSLGVDLPVEKANLARLASYTRAAHEGGVAFVALDEQFRLRSDRAVRRDAWLDPVVAARRISPHARSAGLVSSVPLRQADPGALAGELAQMAGPAGTWAGLQVSAGTARADAVADVLDHVSRSLGRTRTGSRPVARPRVVVPLRSEVDIELAGSVADVVRVRERDLSWARELRYAVRATSRAAGRGDVSVLVDLHTVISADRGAAEARAGLVADIAGEHPSWAGALEAVGTAEDVVETMERWITAGAADGFVILPGSVPADVAALLREVVPGLRARGLLAEAAAPAAAPARPAVDGARKPQARRAPVRVVRPPSQAARTLAARPA
ncbi:hypothetical protein V2J56_04050 [Georgenia sp. MJ206]|uniref:hypothetical protein n=1 Tax=Georgenia wangjunii TaxID=3117730 RepID=UPI002F26408A